MRSSQLGLLDPLGNSDGVRGEIVVVSNLVEVLCIGWIKTTIRWNEMEDDFIGEWLDGGHEAELQGEYVFFVVDRLEVVDCS